MLAVLNSLNAHNFTIFQPILMILVSKLMVHRALSDKIYSSLGLLSPYAPCENEVVFIGTVLELSGTHFNGTFWDNHLIPINPNLEIIWY